MCGRSHGWSCRDDGLPGELERAEVQVESQPVEGVTGEVGDPEEGEGENTPSL
jgi:hypothetical protein